MDWVILQKTKKIHHLELSKVLHHNKDNEQALNFLNVFPGWKVAKATTYICTNIQVFTALHVP